MSKGVIQKETISGLESLEVSDAATNAIREADSVFPPKETKACLDCGEAQATDKSLLDKLYEGSGLKGVVDDLHEEEMDKFQTDKDFREGIEEGDQEKINDAIRRGNEHRKDDSPFVDVVETGKNTATKIKEGDYKGAIIVGATGAAETAAKRVPGGKQVVKKVEKTFGKKQVTKSGGRSGKQARLKEMMNDPKVSSADRGWLKNDTRHVQTGNKSGLRLPRNGRKSPGRKASDKGYELAHPHNKPASQGNGYDGSKLKNHADHKVETRLHRHRY